MYICMSSLCLPQGTMIQLSNTGEKCKKFINSMTLSIILSNIFNLKLSTLCEGLKLVTQCKQSKSRSHSKIFGVLSIKPKVKFW